MDSQLGRENQKLEFDVKFKIVFAPISRMSTGVTSYFSRCCENDGKEI